MNIHSFKSLQLVSHFACQIRGFTVYVFDADVCSNQVRLRFKVLLSMINYVCLFKLFNKWKKWKFRHFCHPFDFYVTIRKMIIIMRKIKLMPCKIKKSFKIIVFSRNSNQSSLRNEKFWEKILTEWIRSNIIPYRARLRHEICWDYISLIRRNKIPSNKNLEERPNIE